MSTKNEEIRLTVSNEPPSGIVMVIDFDRCAGNGDAVGESDAAGGYVEQRQIDELVLVTPGAYGGSMSKTSPPFPVEIIRSPRRKKTVQARVSDGKIVVRVPEGLSKAEEARLVDSIVRKVARKVGAGEVDLATRARRLARRYGLPQPSSITWSDRQNTRWGSCTAADGSIRISSRLSTVPEFVLDFVVLHELIHLRVAGHGPDFQELVQRYPQAERATGYLMALSHHFDSNPAEE